MGSKNELDEFIYSYDTSINTLDEENRVLKQTVNELKKEVDRLKENPLMVCDVKELLGEQAIIKIPNGNQFLVNISKGCEKLQSGDGVLVEQKNLTIIKKQFTNKKFDVEKFVIIEKPKTSWKEVGGLKEQVRELHEVIELPLKNPKLFKEVGIQPPKGILLHGPPGTGKTLLAKAVAASTNSTFIEIVGSELVQKFIGEGAKLVKEIFQLAKEKSPAIIFIDELDALAATRVDIGTSGEREVQRTFMQLLSEIDGFKHIGEVKVIGCTNRKDILDPAITRPGRLDRLIFVPLPSEEGRKEILKIHTNAMNLEKVDLNSFAKKIDKFSGAEIKAACTEAGYFAIRENRKTVTSKDFNSAIEKVMEREKEGSKEQISMFG